MDDLTPRQAEILNLIRELTGRGGLPPTRAELAARLGLRSLTTVAQHLDALARKGWIELLPNASRGILLKESPGIPVVGRVAAGSPILAEQHIETHYQLDPRLFSPKADYLLRVRGTSMREAGILNGDLLAVHRTTEVRSGQIVVARLDDEVTVKRLRRQGSLVELLAENPEFLPIVLDLRSHPLVIEGLGVGVIRNGRPL